MKWISVKDALPKVENWHDLIKCIVVYEGYSYGGGTYQNVTGRKEDALWKISHIHSAKSLEVTNWMLLPEPPEND